MPVRYHWYRVMNDTISRIGSSSRSPITKMSPMRTRVPVMLSEKNASGRILVAPASTHTTLIGHTATTT